MDEQGASHQTLSGTVKIGNAARRTGVPVKTIRYYEEIGALSPVPRTPGGFRLYGETELRRLTLLRRARLLGLPLAQATELADLAFADGCAAYERRLAGMVARRLAEVRHTVRELRALEAELERVSLRLQQESCPHESQADDCPSCHLIDDDPSPITNLPLATSPHSNGGTAR